LLCPVLFCLQICYHPTIFNFNECVTTQCLVAASSFSLFSVAILARLVMKISDIFSHRDKYLRHEQELFCK